MKKLNLLIVVAAMMLMASSALAQTASGTLTVTANVSSSIKLVFVTDAAGVALTGSGTNAATLAFGAISAFGAPPAGVVITPNANSFTASSAVDVLVSKSNTASANYTLKAQLGAADAVNSWTVGGVAVTNAAQATVTATGTYASNVNFPVAITFLYATPAPIAINNTIAYSATAN